MQEYKFTCGGKELAKVLYYYGLIPDTNSIEYKIICPFHNDLNPSMIVNMETGSYFCFGCQLSGNAFTFVREMEKDLNDLQAGLKYFKILKSKRVEKVDLSGRVKKKKKSSKQAHNEACDYYYGLSSVNWLRKTDNEEIKACGKYMSKRGFTRKTLNMCHAKVTYNQSYPIIFPMLDNGKFRGWVCRTMSPEVEKKRKYLYNEGFTRRDTLVGTYGNKKYAIVVEGYMDRLKFVQCLKELGCKEDVVAILGWKMSNEQILKLKEAGVRCIISALDNDECGRKGTKYLETKFEVVRFQYLKGVKDIGEMSLEVFEKCYNRTMTKYLTQE